MDDEFNQDPEYPEHPRPKTASRPRKDEAAATKPKISARNYTLGLLGQRDYSAAALKDKLKLKSYAEADIEAALQFAQEYGFQNDERYAGVKAQNDATRMGNRNVQAKLREKGIAPELIAEKVAELEPERDRVLAAAARFEGKPLDEKLEQKAYRFLSTRGFSTAAVKAAMAHLKATQPPAPDPEPATEVEEAATCPEEALAREVERGVKATNRFAGKPFDQKLQQQAYRFYTSRGYSKAAVKALMAHWAAVQPPPPEAEEEEAAAGSDPDAFVDELELEVERALKEARKFEGKTFDAALRNKVYRFLATRGYSSKAIKIAMARLADGPGDED